MQLTGIRIDEIVKVTHLPCYARGRATFDNGRSYPFDANFAHGYGDDAVVVYRPAGGRELKAGTRVHKAIMDRLGFPDIASASATRSRPSRKSASRPAGRSCDAERPDSRPGGRAPASPFDPNHRGVSLRRKSERAPRAEAAGVTWRAQPRGFESRPPRLFPSIRGALP